MLRALPALLLAACCGAPDDATPDVLDALPHDSAPTAGPDILPPLDGVPDVPRDTVPTEDTATPPTGAVCDGTQATWTVGCALYKGIADVVSVRVAGGWLFDFAGPEPPLSEFSEAMPWSCFDMGPS